MSEIWHVPGPCSISWKAADGGNTKSGVQIQINTNIIPITDDASGNAPADYILGGKSAIVTCSLIDFDKIPTLLAALRDVPFKGSPTALKVGWILFDGDSGNSNQIGEELIITERTGGQWKARYTYPLDPETVMLSSQREIELPLQFLIVPDQNGVLFQYKPSYVF